MGRRNERVKGKNGNEKRKRIIREEEVGNIKKWEKE